MISVIHRRIVSTKAEWRADPARRSLPALAEPLPWPAPVALPKLVNRLKISANGRLYVTHQVGQLKPWHPVRLVRNERRAYYTGQQYAVEDYYLLLQVGPRPEELPQLRLIDLQLDRA
jgi:hypothetical protein